MKKRKEETEKQNRHEMRSFGEDSAFCSFCQAKIMIVVSPMQRATNTFNMKQSTQKNKKVKTLQRHGGVPLGNAHRSAAWENTHSP